MCKKTIFKKVKYAHYSRALKIQANTLTANVLYTRSHLIKNPRINGHLEKYKLWHLKFSHGTAEDSDLLVYDIVSLSEWLLTFQGT